MRLLLWPLLILLTLPVVASETYLEATAQRGDGVLSLLRRYSLAAYSCNVDAFYRLNQLEKTDGLVQNRVYRLPIRRYNYNGRSIRSTIGISDYELAVDIQHYNRTMRERGLRKAEYETDQDLWLPHHFLHCYDEIDQTQTATSVEATSTTEKPAVPYAIFGEKYRQVSRISSELQGQIIYVVAGHGGPDPGAIGNRSQHTLCEDEYAYDVCLRLCRELIARGAIAYMIVRDNDDGIRDDSYLKCDQDEVVWGDHRIPLNQKERLYQRASIINRLFEKHKKQGVNSQTTVVIHVDSNNRGLRQDVFFYHLRNSRAGEKIAEALHQTFKKKYRIHQASRTYHGTVRSRDLYMLRETAPQAVYIELANIRNREDQRRLVIKENRQALAKWLAEGLVEALQ